MECKRCGYVWEPMGNKKPKQCPKCKQYYYDKEREWVKKSSAPINIEQPKSTEEVVEKDIKEKKVSLD